jgi:hypothetical protein
MKTLNNAMAILCSTSAINPLGSHGVHRCQAWHRRPLLLVKAAIYDEICHMSDRITYYNLGQQGLAQIQNSSLALSGLMHVHDTLCQSETTAADHAVHP